MILWYFYVAENIVLNNLYFYPNIISIKERIYLAGNITCSGTIRDELLSKYCSVSPLYCYRDYRFYRPETNKNPYVRKYLGEFKIFGHKINYGKCEDL